MEIPLRLLNLACHVPNPRAAALSGLYRLTK